MDKGMDIRNSIFIYKKQVKDTGKNMALLVQFVMFPMMAAIMENAIHLEDMPEHFFVGMFAVMHVGMAPLTVTVSIISEEKEKNTLRMLLLANVRPLEYLCGIGSFVFSACMAGSIPFGILGGYEGKKLAAFLLIMAAGILASMLFGAAIGIWSKSQAAGTSVLTPVMMIFAFLPMLAMFNKTIAKVANLAWSQHIQLLMNSLETGMAVQPENVIAVAVNIFVASGLFLWAYQKKGLT